MVLEARGVTVAYGPRPVLADVDLSVRAGQVLAVVGPNGAGKSTLLAVLAGDLVPDAGTVAVDGHPYAHWSPDELAVRRGVLLQQVDVSFPFTVTQIVRMGRAPWAGTAAEDWDDDVVASALFETDVDRFSERTYTSLSGGERARAALARVLAQEPVALLLDEPTAALDIRHQELMLALARRRAARGDAVVVVMHDLGPAAAYADVVAVLDRGRVRAAGPPAEVFTGELLSEVYEHPIDVLRHPETGTALIVPRRAHLDLAPPSAAPDPARRDHPAGRDVATRGDEP
ncbi:MAG: heme ABC transporter ATP-binding protein [Acidimicrobiia bacterium]